MSFRPSNGAAGHIPPRLPFRWVLSRSLRRSLALGALAVFPALHLAAAGASAQADPAAPTLGEVLPGGELENYLRLLQVAGKTRAYPWSVRGFSPDDVDRLAPADSAHPWSARYVIGGGRNGEPEVHLHPVRTRAVFNSAFPHGGNDGAVWAGRGLTTAVEAGVTARWRFLTLTLAPVAFRAENTSFDLYGDLPAEAPFADGRNPHQIDLPQRFGDGAYSRIDPGQSTVRADLGPAALGLSTANQVLGPAMEYPIVQGTNAPGFAHAFLGTSRPVDLWVGKVHGRAFWGRLEQSPFATTAPDSATRFGTGLVVAFTPRGVPGLEVGFSRFFHMPWPDSGGIGGEQIFKPLETFFKVNLYNVIRGNDSIESRESVVANQLASVFGRWVFPESGLELYGELASEDHRHNLRDWLLEPDHATAYSLGFRKVWMRDDRRFWSLRGELLNGQASHLGRTRRQDPFYIHAHTRQGHTSRGQLLGSPAAYGGAASTVAADFYHPGGRVTGFWRRTVRQERNQFLVTGVSEAPDVMQSLGAEALLFRGRWELVGGLEGVYDVNRNFESDVANLSATFGVRARL